MEMLSNQFNNLLTQYQETYQQFLSVISSNSDASNNLMQISDSAFVGESNISTIQNSSIDNCVSSCSSNSSCSGATFNNDLNTCTLSSGTGNVINSSNQIAIVEQALYYSNQLQNLNQQLTNINNEMSNISNNDMNNYATNEQNINNKAQILNNNYQALQQDRSQIDDMINQYDTLNAALQNGSINVTSNYYNYILLLIIAIFLIYVLLKYSTKSNEQYGGGHLKMSSGLLLLFFILGVIIVFNSWIKK